MNGGLNYRAVEPQLVTGGHLEVAGQRNHPLVEHAERHWSDDPGPAQQRRVSGHLLLIDPAELAQHQAVPDEMLEVLVAPTIQPFDHKETHDDLDWRPGATRRQTPA
jgi:hypothetical protein